MANAVRWASRAYGRISMPVQSRVRWNRLFRIYDNYSSSLYTAIHAWRKKQWPA